MYYSAYFVVEQNNVANNLLLHNIFCHKLCLFCRALVSIKACSISCLLDIHRHFIKLLQELISVDDVFPCSNVRLRANNFLCLWHVHKALAENLVKKIAKTKDQIKVLFALGQIMYSKALSIR